MRLLLILVCIVVLLSGCETTTGRNDGIRVQEATNAPPVDLVH